MTSRTCFFALDLEFEQPSREILSIGVAYMLPDGAIVKSNFMVTPSQPLSPFIKDLTGLADSDFDYSLTREQCFEQFLDAHRDMVDAFKRAGDKFYMGAITWGYDDVSHLNQELIAAGCGPTLSGRSIDLKSVMLVDRVCRSLSVSGNLGLKTALNQHKVTLAGRAHNSADDAYNTIMLFKTFTEKRQAQHAAARSFIDAY